MTEEQYLQKVLTSNSLTDKSPEVKEIRAKRKDLEDLVRSVFPTAKLKVREGGSLAKHTMIATSYDGDIAMYFAHDDESAGSSLEAIYNAVADALSKEYLVHKKGSALRISDPNSSYTHIDVVPGRFVGSEETDAFLYQNTGEKSRLKTNLNTHIDHIRDSGHRDAIKMVKLWKYRYSINVKTFVLELLTIKLLKSVPSDAPLSTKLRTLFRALEDKVETTGIEDPANPSGNDLSPIFDFGIKASLKSAAGMANANLDNAQNDVAGWVSIFGEPLESPDEIQKAVSSRPEQRPYSK